MTRRSCGTRPAPAPRWGDLLRHGVRLFEYMPTMYHCKAMIVDDLWTSVGSSNFDSRSFRLNDEANLNVYDRAFALEQAAWFERDKFRCRPDTLERWEGREFSRTLTDSGAGLIGTQL